MCSIFFPASLWSQPCVPFLPCSTVASTRRSISSLLHCGVTYVSHFFPVTQWSHLLCPISSLLHRGVTCVCLWTVESPSVSHFFPASLWSHLLCPISSLLHCGVSYVSHFFPVPQWTPLSSPPTDKTSSLCSPLTDKTYLSVPHSLLKLISVFPTHC